jgi:hypothetical protein
LPQLLALRAENAADTARTHAMSTTTCEKCGHEIKLAEHPFCPHGYGAVNVEAVTWPGGKWFENLGDSPVRCDSPADLKREMDARGLMPFVRHIDGSPHTRSWATMDPYTLEQGRILAERQAHTKVRPEAEPGPSAETMRIVREVFQV